MSLFTHVAYSSNNPVAPLIRGGGGILTGPRCCRLAPSELTPAFLVGPFVVNSTVSHPFSRPEGGVFCSRVVSSYGKTAEWPFGSRFQPPVRVVSDPRAPAITRRHSSSRGENRGAAGRRC